MWPCYGVHITVCMALLVCVLCQPVHSCIEPSLHGVDFFLEIFLWRLVSVLFWLINVTRCRPRNCGWWVISARVHWRMASYSQYALPPQSSPQESASGKSQLHSKQSSKGPFPENSLASGGCFEHYTYHVMALGWLKKKEKKKINNSTVSCLPL